jgi:hypothetical protein
MKTRVITQSAANQRIGRFSMAIARRALLAVVIENVVQPVADLLRTRPRRADRSAGDGSRTGVTPSLWLVPASFAAHVAEETPGFTSWARRRASRHYAQRDFIRNNLFGAVLTVGSTAVAARSRDRRVFAAFYVALFVPQMFGNSLFHAGTTVVYREYSPGLFTALGTFLPLWTAVTRGAIRDGLMTRRGAAAGTTVGTLLHAMIVAEQVYFVDWHAWRR